MGKVTADQVKAMCKSHSGNEPHKYHVDALLWWIEDDEKLLWCADYVDMKPKWGQACFLAVTDQHVVLQRMESKVLAKMPDAYVLDLDDVLVGVDYPKPVLFGLTTNHFLVIEATTGQVVIEDMSDALVASAAAAINEAKLGV